MNKPNHEKIYLLPDDGVWCWSDTPAPGAGQRNVDAAEYVRADLFNQMQAERDALAAQVEALRKALEYADNKLHILTHNRKDVSQRLIGDADKAFKVVRDTLAATPQQHLAEALANTAEKFYYMGWEHSLSTKSDDGDHYACGKRLAKSFADSIRKGGAA